MNWISAKDELPDNEVPVLVNIDESEPYNSDFGYMQTVYYRNDYIDPEESGTWHSVDGGVMGEVTHWMPLPEMPKP